MKLKCCVCFEDNVFQKMSHYPKIIFYKIILIFLSLVAILNELKSNFLTSFIYLIVRELFFKKKKNSRKQFLKISHTSYVDQKQFSINSFFLIVPNVGKHRKLFLQKGFPLKQTQCKRSTKFFYNFLGKSHFIPLTYTLFYTYLPKLWKCTLTP